MPVQLEIRLYGGEVDFITEVKSALLLLFELRVLLRHRDSESPYFRAGHQEGGQDYVTSRWSRDGVIGGISKPYRQHALRGALGMGCQPHLAIADLRQVTITRFGIRHQQARVLYYCMLAIAVDLLHTWPCGWVRVFPRCRL